MPFHDKVMKQFPSIPPFTWPEQTNDVFTIIGKMVEDELKKQGVVGNEGVPGVIKGITGETQDPVKTGTIPSQIGGTIRGDPDPVHSGQVGAQVAPWIKTIIDNLGGFGTPQGPVFPGSPNPTGFGKEIEKVTKQIPSIPSSPNTPVGGTVSPPSYPPPSFPSPGQPPPPAGLTKPGVPGKAPGQVPPGTPGTSNAAQIFMEAMLTGDQVYDDRGTLVADFSMLPEPIRASMLQALIEGMQQPQINGGLPGNRIPTAGGMGNTFTGPFYPSIPPVNLKQIIPFDRSFVSPGRFPPDSTRDRLPPQPFSPGTLPTYPTQTSPFMTTVQPGDNLWQMSQNLYGNGNLWPALWALNQYQIPNPNMIYPGQRFFTP